MPGRDDALLWLNDRLGHEVTASMRVDLGESSVALVEIRDVLRHWREGPGGEAGSMLDPDGRREDLEGLYRVGTTMVDVTYLPATAAVRIHVEDGNPSLSVDFEGGVELLIYEVV